MVVRLFQAIINFHKCAIVVKSKVKLRHSVFSRIMAELYTGVFKAEIAGVETKI